MKKQNSKELEEFKEEVYNYLTQQLGVSTTVAKNRMKAYDKGFDEYLEDNWSVSAVATAMWYGY